MLAPLEVRSSSGADGLDHNLTSFKPMSNKTKGDLALTDNGHMS